MLSELRVLNDVDSVGVHNSHHAHKFILGTDSCSSETFLILVSKIVMVEWSVANPITYQLVVTLLFIIYITIINLINNQDS